MIANGSAFRAFLRALKLGIFGAREKLEHDIAEQHAALAKAVQAAEATYEVLGRQLDSTISQAEASHAARVRPLDAAAADQAQRQAESDYRAAVQQAQAECDHARQAALSTISATLARSGLSAAAWSDPAWSRHTPPSNGMPPAWLRVGEMRVASLSTSLPAIPALVPLRGAGHVLLSFDDARTRLGASILEGLAWRLAALTPPGLCQFVLLDPLERGGHLASLLRLPDSMRGTKIVGQEDELEAALQRVATHAEDVLQRRLLNTYPDIEAYNAANPSVAVPYHFVVFVGFPLGFNARAGELLAAIARTGRRTGCYLLGGVQRGERPPHGFDFRGLMRLGTYLGILGSGKMEWTDPNLGVISITPDPQPSAKLVDHLATAVAPLAAAAAESVLAYRDIAVRKAAWWQQSSAGGLEAVVGLNEQGRPASIAVARDGVYHGLVGGATGWGKTNLLHSLVLTLSTAYAPEEMELYLVDFKEGVEFQDYVTMGLPHARAVVLEAEREFGLSILQHLEAEMNRRGDLFKTAGVADLTAYRQRTGQPMARVLLIMDEFIVLFEEDDRLAWQASDSLTTLVQRGRSFGVHILLSTQRPAATFNGMAPIKSQMGLRIAVKCTEPQDSTMILGEGNERAAQITQRGDACITTDPARKDATRIVRTALVGPEERALYLKHLRAFTREQGWQRTAPLFVFSRDAPAAWPSSRAIAARLAEPVWAPLDTPTFWIGQPLRLADDLAVLLESVQGANLLLLGQDEGVAHRLLLAAVLGLVISTTPARGRFTWIGDTSSQQTAGAILEVIQKTIPHQMEVLARQVALDGLAALTQELDARMARLPERPADWVWLIVAGLHRWEEARGPNAYSASQAGEQLSRLLRQGPAVGIHTLVWSDQISSLGAVVGGGAISDTLSQCGHRIGMQMTQNESNAFLGTPLAGRLGSERAYYRDERRPADQLDKFKPYALLSPAETTSVLATSRTHWGFS